MEVGIQNFFGQDKLPKAVVKERRQNVKGALCRLKKGKATPEEKTILVKGMEVYKGVIYGEKQAQIYNVLLYYFFSSRPLTAQQIARMLHFTSRSVWKIIDVGILDLAAIIYGLKGAEEVLMGEEARQSLMKKRHNWIYKRIRLEEEKEVKANV